MHIPDGFLDPKTIITTSALSVAGLAYAVREVKRNIPRRHIPLMGLTAAFVFTAQMLNFPVGAGTSGHLVGSVLVSVLLGPAAAMIIMTTVLIVQAFFFADGGLLTLGANILNMALIAPVAGFIVYKFIRSLIRNERGRIMGASFAGWCSTVIASVLCVGEMALSGTIPWQIALPPMLFSHMVIGIGEGIITALVVAAIVKTRPDLFFDYQMPVNGLRPAFFLVGAGIIITALLCFVAPFASSLPDGLEKTAEVLGFQSRAIQRAPLIPETSFPGFHLETSSAMIAGFIGAGIAGLVSYILARVLLPATPPDSRGKS